MELIDMIVEVDGIMSRKELNGQLGIATAYDDAKGRLAVRLIFDRSIVSLKVDNLSDWAAAKRRDVATLEISKDDIDAVSSPKELLELLQSGAALSQEPIDKIVTHTLHSTAMLGPSQAHLAYLLSLISIQEPGIAEAIYEKALNPPGSWDGVRQGRLCGAT